MISRCLISNQKPVRICGWQPFQLVYCEETRGIIPNLMFLFLLASKIDLFWQDFQAELAVTKARMHARVCVCVCVCTHVLSWNILTPPLIVKRKGSRRRKINNSNNSTKVRNVTNLFQRHLKIWFCVYSFDPVFIAEELWTELFVSDITIFKTRIESIPRSFVGLARYSCSSYYKNIQRPIFLNSMNYKFSKIQIKHVDGPP